MISAKIWLEKFHALLGENKAEQASQLFAESGNWRDYLPFGWSLQTLEGQEQISQFVKDNAVHAGLP